VVEGVQNTLVFENEYPSRQNLKYLDILKNEKLILEQALEGLSKPYAG